MAVWFIPMALAQDEEEKFLREGEFSVPTEGLPELTGALWFDQLENWLRKVHPDLSGEMLAAKALLLWRLGHDVDVRDNLVLPDAGGTALLVGEVTSLYARVERPEGSFHVFRVRWNSQKVPLTARFREALRAGQILEVGDAEMLASLKPSIPSLRNRGATIFKWLTVTILICEFIYWWPR